MARIHSMTIEAPITKVMCNCCWLLSVVLYWNTTTQGSNKASRLRSKAVLASSVTSSPLLPDHWWSSKKQMLWTESSQGCVAECPPCGQPQHDPFEGFLPLWRRRLEFLLLLTHYKLPSETIQGFVKNHLFYKVAEANGRRLHWIHSESFGGCALNRKVLIRLLSLRLLSCS